MKLYMKFIERIKRNSGEILASSILLCLGVFSCCKPDAAYASNLRTLFQNNSAYIYTINVRTFGAQDYNHNDIIEPELGEVSGTFVNAIPKLKLLKEIGVNTVYLLPITKIGKLHALGTAGSLYALDSFDTLNPQLFDSTDLEPDIKKQAKKFVAAAHKLGMNVIVDLPACGSYDLSLEKPELFIKDKDGKTVVPVDWTDIRIFDVYEKGGAGLNKNLINEHKKYIDLVKELGVDGIRADVAAIKPYDFWKEIIDYARRDDEGFLFIAEAYFDWSSPTGGNTVYESVERLLDAGFDGYYSHWSDIAEIKTSNEFFKKLNRDIKCLEKYNGTKAMMSAIATHDQKSPISLGYKYWQMVNWLNVLLPHNPYALDGFPAGDEYNYDFVGKTSKTSQTDNDRYSIGSGTFDIKNFSRAPYPPSPEYLIGEYQDAMKFRYMLAPVLSQKETIELSTNNPSVFAFQKQKGGSVVLVIGNLDIDNPQKVTVKTQGVPDESTVIPFKMLTSPTVKKGKVFAELKPYEIQVFLIEKALVK